MQFFDMATRISPYLVTFEGKKCKYTSMTLVWNLEYMLVKVHWLI